MARYEFKLPDIGEGIAEAEIVAWHIKVGDMVKEDQQLADMMTDKATVEMESPVAGTVVESPVKVGDQIPIGSVLVVIETEGEGGAAPAPPARTRASADGERQDQVALADGLVEERPRACRGDARAPARPAGRRPPRWATIAVPTPRRSRTAARATAGRRRPPQTVRPEPVEGPSSSSLGGKGRAPATWSASTRSPSRRGRTSSGSSPRPPSAPAPATLESTWDR
jgi:pyruvate/2-oxoglutarate dehydrogenase complex dihydrolipoamide acyltransferase (E2) component